MVHHDDAPILRDCFAECGIQSERLRRNFARTGRSVSSLKLVFIKTTIFTHVLLLAAIGVTSLVVAMIITTIINIIYAVESFRRDRLNGAICTTGDVSCTLLARLCSPNPKTNESRHYSLRNGIHASLGSRNSSHLLRDKSWRMDGTSLHQCLEWTRITDSELFIEWSVSRDCESTRGRIIVIEMYRIILNCSSLFAHHFTLEKQQLFSSLTSLRQLRRFRNVT